MNPSYGNGNFGYQGPSQSYMGTGSDDSNSGDGNNNGTHEQQDILENFPYLRHGFGHGLHQQPHFTTVPAAPPQSQSLNANNFKTPYQHGFAQIPGNDSAMNTDSFSQLMGSQHALQGPLPSMSTFNTSFTHMRNKTSDAARLPMAMDTYHLSHLVASISHPIPSSVQQPEMHAGANYNVSAGTNINSNLGSNSMQFIQTAEAPYKTTSQLEYENQNVNQTALTSITAPSENILPITGSNNPKYDVIKIEPLNIPSISLHSSISLSSEIPSKSIPSNLHSPNIVKVETDELTQQSKLLENGDQAIKTYENHETVEEKGKSTRGKKTQMKPVKLLKEHQKVTPEGNIFGKVRFFLKGKLRHRKDVILKPIFQILSEPIDYESQFFDNIVHNFPINPLKLPVIVKQEEPNMEDKPKRTRYDRKKKESKKPYTEPSIAELRASAPTAAMDDDEDDELENESGDVDNDPEIPEEEEDCEADESSANDSMSFGIGNENWYSVAMKKYAEITKGDGPEEVSLSAKKGGRSDPDNPFAITSPSFSESAARALMTTTNSATGTTVMISIMSIGSRKKLIPKIVGSKAAAGGIVSIVNPIEETDDKKKACDNGDKNDAGVKAEKTSIMSKLKREKKEKEDAEGDQTDTDIDRLDISIIIEDDQYVSQGSTKRWQCKICPKSYTTKHNLVAHILDHSDIKPHLCLVCGKYFKQLSHLNTHMLTHDNCKPHKCPLCNKGFTQISHLKRHETVHLQSKPFICDICSRGFAYPSELRIHKDKHVAGKEKCVECDKEFSTPKELREHMLLDQHCNDLVCKHCNRVFKFPSQLRDHLLSHVGSRPFICTECGMDFMKEHHLKAHTFTHTGLRPYACPYCSRAFNQKANMVRHMLIHNSERAFKCDVCSKTFTQPQTLKAHMVVHADKKPYSCKFCGKQFGRLHNLQGHLHIHSDSKPYICSICQSSFTLKGNLNRHKKVKHGLNESTESMEEDAVNFLSSLSDRARDQNMADDFDLDSRDDMTSPDAKSQKKGRKSVPRKHVTRGLTEDEATDGGTDMENTSDGEQANFISYSDEERENEERLKELKSQYFTSADTNKRQSRRKRKQDISYLVENEEEDELSLGDDNDDDDEEEEAENEDNNNKDVEKSERDKNVKIGDDSNSPLKSDSKLLKEQVQGKRSIRKRKRKELDKGFTDGNSDDEDEAQQPQPKLRQRKGCKLDTIIAAKFKNV